MKKVLYSMLLLILGFLVGVCVMGYLSMIASKPFLEIVRLNYQMEEHIKAIRAKKIMIWPMLFYITQI